MPESESKSIHESTRSGTNKEVSVRATSRTFVDRSSLFAQVESDHAKLARAMLALFIRQPGLVGRRKHFR